MHLVGRCLLVSTSNAARRLGNFLGTQESYSLCGNVISSMMKVMYKGTGSFPDSVLRPSPNLSWKQEPSPCLFPASSNSSPQWAPRMRGLSSQIGAERKAGGG